MKKCLNIIILALVFITMVLFSEKGIETMKDVMGKNNEMDSKTVVVVDAGHGGRDPGKVGMNDLLEKDVNLAIAKKLKYFLEQNDIEVVMTRTDDTGLYSLSDRNKKAADLRKRVEIIQDNNPIVAISIHQNSFEQKQYKGAQVFYHAKSPDGKSLAEFIQEQIRETMNDDNKRMAKANNDYYMLKKSICPLVIVECGFLSNEEEAYLLGDETYQEKMAWAIHIGILKQINNMKKK